MRCCVAMSLMLLGGFALAASGRIGVIVACFALLFGYFGVTAALGRDPLYGRLGVSTRPDADSGLDPIDDPLQDDGATADSVAALQVAALQEDPMVSDEPTTRWGSSLLGG